MAREVRPWDLLDPNTPRAPKHVQEKRMSTCSSCPQFFKPTKQCKECLCIMPLKTQLLNATCPLNKWEGEIHVS